MASKKPTTTIPPAEIAKKVADSNGQRDLSKQLQDPAKGAPKPQKKGGR